MHLNSFVAGILCGIYLKKNPTTTKQQNNTFWLAISFALIFLLIWARPHLESLLGIKLAFTNGLLAPAFLFFIVLLARHKGIITKAFSAGWLILLGEASYSLYILQKPVHGIYDKIIVPRISLSDTTHFYIFLIMLIIISILSYKYFETPMRKAIRRRFS
jgi:peptidoglycan/LPS O-acetylase OafA/YrhL